MPFCSKCGIELNAGDVFCSKCGFKVFTGVETEQLSSSADLNTSEKLVLTREESIALADKLSREYKEYERLNQEINDNERTLNRPSDYTFRPHAAFKFFWPFLIYAVIAFWFFYFLFLFIASGGSSSAAVIFAVLCLGAPVVLLIIGGIRATRLRDEYNAAESESIRTRKKNEHDLKKRTDELRSKRTVVKRRLDQYNNVVPSAFRTSSRMEKVRILIQSGKAEDFYEAMDMQIQK